MDKTAIRDAATVILTRPGPTGPEVLMGQRGAKAAFMPNKFVFPGGAVDPEDADIPLAGVPSEPCLSRMALAPTAATTTALLASAVREVWEETGLILGTRGTWPGRVPTDWLGFAEAGYLPSAEGFRYVFRAVTPPGRTRRFDARFFLVDAARVAGNTDDFSRACDELSHLQWIALSRVRAYDLPFITEVVLAELEPILAMPGAPETVPFVTNDDPVSSVRRLR